MKKDVHPNYGPAKISCACGKVWETMSTRKDFKVGICADCHPFFTGKQKLIDTAGPCREIQPPLSESREIIAVFFQDPFLSRRKKVFSPLPAGRTGFFIG